MIIICDLYLTVPFGTSILYFLGSYRMIFLLLISGLLVQSVHVLLLCRRSVMHPRGNTPPGKQKPKWQQNNKCKKSLFSNGKNNVCQNEKDTMSMAVRQLKNRLNNGTVSYLAGSMTDRINLGARCYLGTFLPGDVFTWGRFDMGI